jgi:hypothetical protein
MGDPFIEDLPRELRELVERETLRELVRAGLLRDPPPLYPGAETVKLARNGEMVKRLLGNVSQRELAGRLTEVERVPPGKMFIFKEWYNLLGGWKREIRLWNPTAELVVWLGQRGDSRIQIDSKKVKALKDKSKARVVAFSKVKLPKDIIVGILSFTEPFTSYQLRGFVF